MNLKVDSRKVKPGDTFIAIRGAAEDGHKYIDAAIKNGATKIICEYGNYDVETIIVPNSKKYLDKEMDKLFKNLLKDIKMIGVTGTNGKTTSTFFVYELLKLLGNNASLIGTTGFYTSKGFVPLNNTTPGQIELYELFSEAVKYNSKYIVMEISSHALAQERVKGLFFDIEGFTNLTQDHLDSHKTMEGYKNSKLKILDFLKNDGTIIVNNDDKYSDEFKRKRYITFGTKESNLTILDIKLFEKHSEVLFNYKNNEYRVKLNFTSDFNIYNYVMAFLIVNTLGFSSDEIINVSDKLTLPPGRSQEIGVGEALAVIDFAHSPDSLEKIITNYKNIRKGKVITITGCDGDRDKIKRPIMAKIACEKSDYVIFTHVDIFNEDPESIKSDMLKAADKEKSIFIDNRKEAILHGLKMLKSGDTLLILGMGHETYQTVGKEKIPHSDYEEVIKFINS